MSALRTSTMPAALLILLVAALAAPPAALACPFCTALQPTLSQRRERAPIVALAEYLEAKNGQAEFRVHQVLEGGEHLTATEPLKATIDVQLKPGKLAILFAGEDLTRRTWTCVPANELGLAYFVKAPSLRVAAAERLKYFARYLEHADPLIAEDAFNEFGHAPYDAVESISEQFDVKRLRQWLADPQIPAQRKGFYGLALGLAGRKQEPEVQAALFTELILAPADDFRAGFDGVLGGFLVLKGEEALELIEVRFLANPQARDGDVRHAVSALRFYQEFGRDISTERLARALRHLLAREEFAPEVIVDLARWRSWDALSEVVALYTTAPQAAPMRRAVVGYLLNCPRPQAATELEKLRVSDPRGVAEAEQAVSLGFLKSS